MELFGTKWTVEDNALTNIIYQFLLNIKYFCNRNGLKYQEIHCNIILSYQHKIFSKNNPFQNICHTILIFHWAPYTQTVEIHYRPCTNK